MEWGRSFVRCFSSLTWKNIKLENNQAPSKMSIFLLLRELEQLIGLNRPGSSKGRRRIMENENFSL